MRTPFQPPPNPGNAGTAVLLDTGAVETGTAAYPHRGNNSPDMRARVVVYVTVQPVTLRHHWYAPGSSTPRLLTSDAVAAGTPLAFDKVLWPGRNVLDILNGATAPTIFETACEVTDQA